MAGKLFPETYIGDSEDLFKKIPTGKKHIAPQRDLKSASPLSMDNESHDSDNLADSAELKEQLVLEDDGHQDGEVDGSKEEETKRAHSGHQKEEDETNQHHQKPQHRNLLDFGWLQEKEEEEAAAHEDDLSSMTEDVSGQEVVTKNSVCDPQEGIWPPPGDNTEEHLEPRVNEVALIDSFESDGKFTLSASISGADDLNSSPVDHEGYQLCDEEDHLKDSSASTGYFPCYRTYVEFPRYQPPSGEDSPPAQGKSERQPGSCRDASVQCDGCVEESIVGSEKRGAEANNNSKEAKTLVAPHEVTRGQAGGGPRPVSSGRKLEGLGGKHTRHLGDGGQEAGSNRKDYEGGATKPCTPGSSPTRTKIGIAKDPQGLGPRTSQLPIATGARKSLQKRKHRTGRPDEKEQTRLGELKPLLHDQRSLPPGPEEDTRILNTCYYGTEDAGENSEVRLVKAKAKNTLQRNLSAHSCPSTTGSSSPPEPRPITSRLSFHSIISWVRKIFQKPPSGQPQPSTSRGTETSRRVVASRLRQWLTPHSSRIHPHPP